MSYTELLKECESAFDSISISEMQAVNIELAKRDQSSTKVWFQFRSGCITASKAACHTEVSQPSQTLIMSICYPENYRFTSKATKWGHQNNCLY